MRALVIDDSRTMRRLVGAQVSALGFEVREAGDGREALDVLESGWVPDLATVDWHMPVMDGLGFVSAVAARPEWATRMLLLSAEAEASLVGQALAAGAAGHLTKPFTPGALRDELVAAGALPEAVSA